MIKSVEIQHSLLEAMQVLHGRYALEESIECILRLLLFKRLSDLSFWEDPFVSVPIELRWSEMDRQHCNLGQFLSKALRQIEDENPYLTKVFTGLGTSFWDRFDETSLQPVVNLFSRLDLQGESPSDLLQLGKAVSAFIEQTTSTKANMGGIYTPQNLTSMMVKLIDPPPNASIYDPVCRYGEFLVEAVRFILQQDRSLSSLKISGQNANFSEHLIARGNLMLNGMYSSEICTEGSILNSRFARNGEQELFDCILTNPPFNQRSNTQSREIEQNSNQFIYGFPHRKSWDFLYIQHVLQSLKKSGKAAMVLPLRVLFTEGSEGDIRRRIIEDDWIEAVIELAPRLFYNLGVAVAVVIFNQSKTNRGKTLFIDASHEYKGERGRNILQPENIDRILSAYRDPHDEEGFLKLSSIREIAENNYNLSVNRYVVPIPDRKVDVAAEIEQLRWLEAERFELEEKVDYYLRALGIEI